MRNKIIAIVIVSILLLLVLFFVKNGFPALNPNPSSTVRATPTPISAMDVIIRYTSEGFKPNIITVKKGAHISWINNSGDSATVNSDDYPANQKYPVLNLGNYAPGSSVQVVLEKPGEYTYYNFTNKNHRGTIIVQ